MNVPYPWQHDIWQHLIGRYQAGTLPHALLVVGGTGLGKLDFAIQLAHVLLCKNRGTQESLLCACGSCRACRLLAAGTHPDYYPVFPEQEGKAITVDRVRQITQFFTLTSQYAGHKIVIVSPAESMNKFSANSLLKTLEEPTAGALLILVTSRPSRLLATIRSRCQIVTIPAVKPDMAKVWLTTKLESEGISQDNERLDAILELAQGAPLTALQYARVKLLDQYRRLVDEFDQIAWQRMDPVAASNQWQELGIRQVVNWLMHWTMQMIRLKSVPDHADNNTGYKLQNLAKKLDLDWLFAYWDKLIETARLADSQINQQLAIEDLLITWSQMNRNSVRP